jgi:hypothetical protein
VALPQKHLPVAALFALDRFSVAHARFEHAVTIDFLTATFLTLKDRVEIRLKSDLSKIIFF